MITGQLLEVVGCPERPALRPDPRRPLRGRFRSPSCPRAPAAPAPRPGADPLSGYRALAASFRRHLLAENKSPRTVETYGEGVRLLGEFLARAGLPTDVAPPPARARRGLHRRAARPLEAGDGQQPLPRPAGLLPLAGRTRASSRPPRWRRCARRPCPRRRRGCSTDDQLRRLLKACEGREFADRRDAAILRLLVDTGMRRAEIAGLRVEDVDFDHDVAVVLGKGRRPRACPVRAQGGRRPSTATCASARAAPRRRPAGLWLGAGGR